MPETQPLSEAEEAELRGTVEKMVMAASPEEWFPLRNKLRLAAPRMLATIAEQRNQHEAYRIEIGQQIERNTLEFQETTTELRLTIAELRSRLDYYEKLDYALRSISNAAVSESTEAAMARMADERTKEWSTEVFARDAEIANLRAVESAAERVVQEFDDWMRHNLGVIRNARIEELRVALAKAKEATYADR